MKCRKCGHKNKKTSQFCIACGEPLDGESGGKSNLIYVLVVIIIVLIVAVGILGVNSGLFNNNDASIENATNDSQSNSVDNVTDDVQSDSVEDDDSNVEGVPVAQSNSKTINEQSSEVIEIYGVPFTVPDGGKYRTQCTYQFNFNGHLCEVEEVEHYESSDSQRSFSDWNPSKYYPGGESYILTVNNHIWKGIKIEKDNRWYHISMKSNNDAEVLEMLDWMYEKNSWVGH